jgi:hypothetical protein
MKDSTIDRVSEELKNNSFLDKTERLKRQFGLSHGKGKRKKKGKKKKK